MFAMLCGRWSTLEGLCLSSAWLPLAWILASLCRDKRFTFLSRSPSSLASFASHLQRRSVAVGDTCSALAHVLDLYIAAAARPEIGAQRPAKELLEHLEAHTAERRVVPAFGQLVADEGVSVDRLLA